MMDKLAKAILPNQDNDGTPIILQTRGAVVVMMVAILVFMVSSFHGEIINNYAGDSYAAVVAAVLIDQSNEERAEVGLPALRPSPELTASAFLKARDMAEGEYFAHVSPDGVSPWYWFDRVGYRFNFAGENLAVNFRDSGAVTRAWMNSPSHKDNIISENFEEIGIATAVGRYKGKRTTFVAQHFGAPYTIPGVSDDVNRLIIDDVRQNNSAIDDADQFLAAVNSVSAVDRLMIQPNILYTIIYASLLILIGVVTTNAYVKSDSRSRQQKILLYGGIVALVVVCLGLTSLQLFSSEIIAGNGIMPLSS